MKSSTRHEIELVETVQAHLDGLSNLAVYDSGEARMRAATGALRVLISDSVLQRAWTIAGLRGPYTVKTYTISDVTGDHAIAYCGGGDIIPGIPASACHNAELKLTTLNLHDFSRQRRIVVGKESATTSDIIKFFANALGGSHFDPDGKTAIKFDLLRRIEAGDTGRLFISHFNQRSPLYHEVLSIAQSLVRSPQAAELLKWRPKKTTGQK